MKMIHSNATDEYNDDFNNDTKDPHHYHHHHINNDNNDYVYDNEMTAMITAPHA